MDSLTFALLSAIPQAAIIYTQATILPMRRTWLFALAEVLLCVVALLLKLAEPAVGLWARDLVAIAAMVAAPLASYRRETPLAYRIMACGVAILLMMLGEMACGAIWVAWGGQYSPDGIQAAHPMLSIAIHLFFAAMVLVPGRMFRSLLSNWEHGALSPSGSVLFCAMPLSQVAFIWVLLMMLAQGGPVSGNDPMLFAAAGLIAFCVASDALLISAVRRYKRSLMEQARAEALDRRLREQLAEQAQLDEQIAGTARLRHDMRNHLLVLTQLVERGELDRAGSYVDETLAELGKNAASPHGGPNAAETSR